MFSSPTAWCEEPGVGAVTLRIQCRCLSDGYGERVCRLGVMVMVTEYVIKSEAYGDRLCWSDGWMC